MATRTPKPKRRRERGDDGISWDKVNKCYVGTISLGYGDDGKRLRRYVRGKTKTEVKDKLDELHEEIKAGIETPATYTVRQCVADWLDSLELDPHTMATYRGQAEKWIYPKIGRTKLKDFKATDADRFFRDVAKVLSKASLVKIKSTLVRSIRRAQKYDLIGRNVAELVDLPQGQPGHPSRAMTEEQASKVLEAAGGQPTSFVKVVKVGQAKYAATHAATRDQRAGVRHLDAPRSSRHGDRHRSRHNHLPVLPRGTRTRCRRERKPQARSAVRLVDHPRPAPRRTAQALLGPRRPRQRSHPRMALSEPYRRRQDAEVEALARPPQACGRRAPSAQRSARRPNGWLLAPPGRTTILCSATRTGACTPATRSTGGSAR